MKVDRTPRNLIRVCATCGKEFQALNANQWYCSAECREEGRRKKTRSGKRDLNAKRKKPGENMKEIRAMVKEDPRYGYMVARTENKI